MTKHSPRIHDKIQEADNANYCYCRSTIALLFILFLAVLALMSCNTTSQRIDNYGTIYKIGYYDGIDAARKCYKERTIETNSHYITNFQYAYDTLSVLDSLKFIKILK